MEGTPIPPMKILDSPLFIINNCCLSRQKVKALFTKHIFMFLSSQCVCLDSLFTWSTTVTFVPYQTQKIYLFKVRDTNQCDHISLSITIHTMIIMVVGHDVYSQNTIRRFYRTSTTLMQQTNINTIHSISLTTTFLEQNKLFCLPCHALTHIFSLARCYESWNIISFERAFTNQFQWIAGSKYTPKTILHNENYFLIGCRYK